MSSVLIATPVYDGTVTIHFFDSMQKLTEKTRGAHTFKNMFIGATLVHRARNAFASMFLNDQNFSHLLFVDSDMGFRPEAIERMLAFDKPFVGCVSPARFMDYDRFHRISRQIDDPALARSVAQNYVAGETLIRTDLGDGKGGWVLDRGFVRAEKIGTGLTLIKREVLERMRERYPELVAEPNANYQGMGVRGSLFQCFETMPDAKGVFLSEDLAFCKRWTEGCGGEVWVCVDEVITHVGQAAFSGKMIDRMRHSELK